MTPIHNRLDSLSPKDRQRLLDAPSPETVVGLRDQLVLCLLIHEVLEVGELVLLMADDLDFDGAEWTLWTWFRLVTFSPATTSALANWLSSSGINPRKAEPILVTTCGGKACRGYPVSRRLIRDRLRHYLRWVGVK